MAMFFPYFELAASLFILILAFELLTRHHGNRLARFYCLFAFVAFLAAIFTYSLRIAFTLDLASNINRISATLWAFVFTLFAHFAILFTKREKILQNPINRALFYFPPIVIGILFLFTNNMYMRHEIQSIGIVSQPAPLYTLFILHTLAYTLLGIILFFSYSKSATQKIERSQALLIAVGASIAVLIGVVNDQIVPLLAGLRVTPPTVVFDIALMNLFIYLAMRRYSLFAVSPSFAADIIIETMPDSLIVTDLEGRVLLVNEEAHKYFHAPKEEIIGKLFCELFIDRPKYEKLYSEVVDKNLEIERFEANLCDPLGECIPSLINANKLRDAFGATLGVVYVIRDIRG